MLARKLLDFSLNGTYIKPTGPYISYTLSDM
jgi:hypothetical protein